jgi:FdhD protein
MENSAIIEWPVKKVKPAAATELMEQLAVEEPLELILAYSSQSGRMKKNITVTLRTPGFDKDLAIGFLFTEGIISQIGQVAHVQHNRLDGNQVVVTLVENEKPLLDKASRRFYSNAACGLCGKVSADDLRQPLVNSPIKIKYAIEAGLVYGFPARLSGEQDIFSCTGGLHAAALLDKSGNLLMLREDIGRHNAVDKVIGAALQTQGLEIQQSVLLLSGRAGFELIQKAAIAGIAMVAAIGAPSSMAVELAAECGMTLVGFLKADRFNIYCGADRIVTG